MAERGVVRIEVHVEGVLVVQWVVLPAQLDVGHLQGIADGLDGIGAGALGRPEDRHHAQRQLVTGCSRGREGRRTGSVLGLVRQLGSGAPRQWFGGPTNTWTNSPCSPLRLDN